MLGFVRGFLILLVYILFTVPIFILLQPFVLIKLVVPNEAARLFAMRATDWLASTCWIFCSNTTHKLLSSTRITVHGDDVGVNRWCLLLSNHQSWVDIMVIIRIFFGKLPPYKFFVKKELLWFPFVGWALWMLDFPVMKRYSRGCLEKNPHLKGKDLEETRRASEKFKSHPVTVMNFVEGTRYTPAKHRSQQSPYRHLLKPRAGGTALVLHAMGEMLEEIVDITIIYPEGVPGLWDYFSGNLREVIVHVRSLPLTRELIGDYYSDPDFKAHFQQWLNNLWSEKDRMIGRYINP
jgi:1-acyl-sn-glycerol-3-phosphate acyltransferase